jgi:hypothetical protein
MSDRFFEASSLPDRWKDIRSDPNAIAYHHIQTCQSQLNGYWDEDDQFHDTIRFTQPLIPTLLSSSFGITPDQNGDTPWLNFRYTLTVADAEVPIGELNLILNDSLEIIDENWLIDIHSSYVLSV